MRRGGISPILFNASDMGQMKLPRTQATKVAGPARPFGDRMLNEASYRSLIPQTHPTEPLISRFYELAMVYGTIWKALIQEEFGDGVMRQSTLKRRWSGGRIMKSIK